MKILFPIALSAVACFAQQAPAQHAPSGVATYVSSAELQNTVKKTASSTVNDTQVRVVSINNEYNVAIGVLHRANTAEHERAAGSRTPKLQRCTRSFPAAERL